MYHVIGLKEDGKMVLFDSCADLPSNEELEAEIEGFDYSQVLVVSDDGDQVERYEYEGRPRLRKVDLV